MEKFQKYALDKLHDVIITGLPKLDIFFNGEYDRNELYNKFQLDTSKKTVLYAPSYKPTSIFSIGEKVIELSKKYNLIVKLHPYSWSGKYASHKQHLFFERKQNLFPNMKLIEAEDHNILPYMFVADTMISDGSSTINEFLALNKCGIIVDLPEETHRDGVPLLENKSSEWLKNSFIHISEDSNLEKAISEAMNPSQMRLENLKKDRSYIFSYLDGRAAERVKNIIIQKIKEKNI